MTNGALTGGVRSNVITTTQHNESFGEPPSTRRTRARTTSLTGSPSGSACWAILMASARLVSAKSVDRGLKNRKKSCCAAGVSDCRVTLSVGPEPSAPTPNVPTTATAVKASTHRRGCLRRIECATRIRSPLRQTAPTPWLNFGGAHHRGDDGAAAGDHAPAAGRVEEQDDRRRDPRRCNRSRLPATRPHQRGRAKPPTCRLQPGWAVSTKAPGYLALGRAAPLRGLGACRVDCGDRALSN